MWPRAEKETAGPHYPKHKGKVVNHPGSCSRRNFGFKHNLRGNAGHLEALDMICLTNKGDLRALVSDSMQ